MIQNILIGLACLCILGGAIYWIDEAMGSGDPYAVFGVLWALPLVLAFFGWTAWPGLFWVAGFALVIAVLSIPFAIFKWFTLIPARRSQALEAELHDLIQKQAALEKVPNRNRGQQQMMERYEARAVEIQTKLDRIRQAHMAKETSKREHEHQARATREAELKAQREAEDAVRARIADKARGRIERQR